MTLQTLLVSLRESAMLGPTAAAQAAGINRGTLYRWETGSRTPDYDALRVLLDLYQATADQRDQAEALRRAIKRGI